MPDATREPSMTTTDVSSDQMMSPRLQQFQEEVNGLKVTAAKRTRSGRARSSAAS